MVVTTILAGSPTVFDNIDVTVGSTNTLEKGVLDVGWIGGHTGTGQSLGNLGVVIA